MESANFKYALRSSSNTPPNKIALFLYTVTEAPHLAVGKCPFLLIYKSFNVQLSQI